VTIHAVQSSIQVDTGEQESIGKWAVDGAVAALAQLKRLRLSLSLRAAMNRGLEA
jgi:hypothetical protein